MEQVAERITSDDIAIVSSKLLKLFLESLTFTVSFIQEDDGSFTGSVEELDLFANAPSKDECLTLLLDETDNVDHQEDHSCHRISDGGDAHGLQHFQAKEHGADDCKDQTKNHRRIPPQMSSYMDPIYYTMGFSKKKPKFCVVM